ncbi:hypothetical protein CCP3SC5AM1_1530005 [Gammaproteobacteria bacterium]
MHIHPSHHFFIALVLLGRVLNVYSFETDDGFYINGHTISTNSKFIGQEILMTKPISSLETKKEERKEERDDYFVSVDTIIIGCTAGAAAGILVASIPLAGSLATGIGIHESFSLLGTLTGMGCGVGSASSAVAIFTAWFINHIKN